MAQLALDLAIDHPDMPAPALDAAEPPLRVLLVSTGRRQHPTARELLAGRASARLVVDWRGRYNDGLMAIGERRHDCNEVIIRSTVAMAHSLGLSVIAEGIETPAQLRRLRSLGCEFGQGHLFSPALSAADTAALLDRWRPAEIVALFSAA